MLKLDVHQGTHLKVLNEPQETASDKKLKAVKIQPHTPGRLTFEN